MTIQGNAAPTRHPLIAALTERHGFTALDEATFDAFASAPGMTLVALLEEPSRYRETLDLAVIAPEVRRAFPDAFRCAVLEAASARAVAARFGVRRWPTLLLVRDGGYVGAIEGLRDWNVYVDEIAALIEAPTRRAPGIGIAVHSADAGCASFQEKPS